MRAVVGACVAGQRPPSAPNIEQFVSMLQAHFLAYNIQFVVLELFESFFHCGVGDYAGCVDHAGPEEGSVEIVAAVVVVADLLFI
jgi:hypothetical protein